MKLTLVSIFVSLIFWMASFRQESPTKCRFLHSSWLAFDPYQDSVMTGVKWIFIPSEVKCSGTLREFDGDDLTREFGWTLYFDGEPNCGIDIDGSQLIGQWLSIQDKSKGTYEPDAIRCFYMHSDSSSTFLTLQEYGQPDLRYFRVDN